MTSEFKVGGDPRYRHRLHDCYEVEEQRGDSCPRFRMNEFCGFGKKRERERRKRSLHFNIVDFPLRSVV